MDRYIVALNNPLNLEGHLSSILTAAELYADPTYDANAGKSWWETHWREFVQYTLFGLTLLASEIGGIQGAINGIVNAFLDGFATAVFFSGLSTIAGAIAGKVSAANAAPNIDEAMDICNKFDIDSAYVKPKHLSTTGGNGAKYIGNSKIEAEIILKNAMRSGRIIQTTNNGLTPLGYQSYSYVLNAGQIVGTKGQTHIFFILSKDGWMLTAYPIWL